MVAKKHQFVIAEKHLHLIFFCLRNSRGGLKEKGTDESLVSAMSRLLTRLHEEYDLYEYYINDMVVASEGTMNLLKIEFDEDEAWAINCSLIGELFLSPLRLRWEENIDYLIWDVSKIFGYNQVLLERCKGYLSTHKKEHPDWFLKLIESLPPPENYSTWFGEETTTPIIEKEYGETWKSLL
jgi:hypothetical protein